MFTRQKLRVPCLKIVSTVPKIWRAVPMFLARVNGVLITRYVTMIQKIHSIAKYRVKIK